MCGVDERRIDVRILTGPDSRALLVKYCCQDFLDLGRRHHGGEGVRPRAKMAAHKRRRLEMEARVNASVLATDIAEQEPELA